MAASYTRIPLKGRIEGRKTFHNRTPEEREAHKAAAFAQWRAMFAAQRKDKE